MADNKKDVEETPPVWFTILCVAVIAGLALAVIVPLVIWFWRAVL